MTLLILPQERRRRGVVEADQLPFSLSGPPPENKNNNNSIERFIRANEIIIIITICIALELALLLDARGGNAEDTGA